MEMTHESRGNHTDTQSNRDTGGGAKAQSIVAVFALSTFELLLILPSGKAGKFYQTFAVFYEEKLRSRWQANVIVSKQGKRSRRTVYVSKSF